MKKMLVNILLFLKIVLLLLSIGLYPVAWLGYNTGRKLREDMQKGKGFCTYWWQILARL